MSGEAPSAVADDRSDPTKGVQLAFTFILRSTQTRPQTEAELTAKLRARGFQQDIVDAALAKARTAGAVDDAAFAHAWVEDRGHRKGYGAARLRDELTRRRVPYELVDEALRALEQRDDFTVAAQLARRRLSTYPSGASPEAVARRLVGYLVRRGYPPPLSQRVAVSVSGLDREWD